MTKEQIVQLIKDYLQKYSDLTEDVYEDDSKLKEYTEYYYKSEILNELLRRIDNDICK